MNSKSTWATIRVAISPSRIEREDLALATDLLEALAALLAATPQVGGVESRDPFTAPAAGLSIPVVERPELIIYCEPEAVSELVQQSKTGAESLGLQVAVSHRLHEGDEWRDEWKKFYSPMRFGGGNASLLLRPSWIERRTGDPERELILDPGRAFGTGLHESTRLCIESLCSLAGAPSKEGFPSLDVALDLGCGSGILGLAALRLFPSLRKVVMADVDAEATATAGENAELNHLSDRVELHTGPVESLPEKQWPLLLANIRPKVLIPSAPAIVSRVAPGGRLILSGILIEESESVEQSYRHLDLRLLAKPEENDWCALVFEREQPSP